MNAGKITLIMAVLAALAMASLFLVPVTDSDAVDDDPIPPYEGVGAVSIDYKNTEVTGEYSSKNLFDDTQIVTVKDYWTLMNGAEVTIEGILIVPEGTTLTVKSDAQLYIAGSVEVKGTFIIEELQTDGVIGGFVELIEGSKATVSGTVIVEGYLDVKGTVVEQSGGSVVIEYDGFLNVPVELEEGFTFHIQKDAEMLVYGTMNVFSLLVDGKLLIDSEVPMDGFSLNIGKDGVIEIRELTSNVAGLFLIQDAQKDMILIAVEGAPVDVTDIEDKNAYCAAIFGGLFVKGNADGTGASSLLISGDVQVSYEYRSESSEDAPEGLYAKAVVSSIGSAKVTEELILGSNVVLDNFGTLVVSGNINAASGKIENVQLNPALITVTGEGVIKSASRIADESKTVGGVQVPMINATRFVDGGFHYYMDINKAIKNTVSDRTLFVLGQQTVIEDLTLPDTNKLDLTGAYQLVIGDGPDDVLTIAEGASMTGVPSIEADKIDVKGTLFIENQLNVPTNVKAAVSSDVEIYELDEEGKVVRDGWLKYTNIRTALDEAQSGDHVDLKRDIVIDYELIIPEQVTLDTNTNDVLVKNGGGWITDLGFFEVSSESQIVVEEKDGDKAAAEIEVSGFAISDAQFDIVTDKGNDYLISGAYFSISDAKKTTWYVTPVPYAAENVLRFDPVTHDDFEPAAPGFYVRANEALVIGDISLTGNKDGGFELVSMIVETYLESGTITLDAAVMFIEKDNVYWGTVTNGNGTAAITGKVYEDGFAIGEVIDNDVEYLLATGSITGVPTNILFTGIGLLADDLRADNIVVDGELSINGEYGKSVIDIVQVNGFLFVEKDVLLESNVIDVRGDVDVKEGGNVVVSYMFVGVDKTGQPTVATVPEVTGEYLVLEYALFAADAVAPESITKDKGLKSTVFYGEGGKKLVTAYAIPDNGVPNKTIKITVENAWLNGWMDKNGNIVDDEVYGTVPEVFASIDYYVYHVTIVADYGVQNVAVDGAMLPHYSIDDNTYYIDLKAGIHSVSVTLASGYTGTAKVYMIQEGTPVELTAGKFTATGTPGTADGIFYGIQVAGAEAATGDVIIHVDPSDPMVVVDKESNDWSIQNILMLVLVIVVGLVAVVLVLRLNRS